MRAAPRRRVRTAVAVAVLAGCTACTACSTSQAPDAARHDTAVSATAVRSAAEPSTSASPSLSTSTTMSSAALSATPETIPPDSPALGARPGAIRAVPLPGVRVRCPAPTTMTPRQLLAQTLMIGVDGRSAAQAARLGSGSTPVGGLFLWGEATTVLRDGVLRRLGAGTLPPMIAVDEEGGRVQRIDAIAGPFPSPQRQATLPADRIRALAQQRGQAMRRLGITVDLAPVVDVRGGATVIGDRAYGTTPAAVVAKAGPFADGLRSAGVLPALKHFPGHGRARGDSHTGGATTPPLSSLQAGDLRVYPPLLDDGPALVMMGHLTVPGLSTRWHGRPLPTSLDAAAYRLLRTRFGYQGVVVTDELGMRAVSSRFDRRTAVRAALIAGADLALVNVGGTGTADVSRLLTQLVDDVQSRRLPLTRVREAAGRVMAVKGCG